MKFALTSEQEMLQDQARRLLAEHCSHERLQAAINGDAPYDEALWSALVEMGLTALLTPEAHGGVGLPLVEAGLIAELLGYAGAPAPLFGHWIATLAISRGDDEALKAERLPGMAAGEVRATVALCGADGGWTPSQWTCRLDGGAVTGRADYVPDAEGAGLIVVGLEGGGLALVDTAAGTQVRDMNGIDRTRPLYELTFEDAPAVRLEGEGLGRRVLDAALALVAADSFGAASRVLEMTLDYIQQREQFGSVIGRFQAVKHQIVNVALEVEPSRALYWYAVYANDHRSEDATRMAALAKSHITEMALQAARDCVELHGGMGYTWEYDLHIWLKRAMANFAWGGAPELHRSAYADAVGW